MCCVVMGTFEHRCVVRNASEKERKREKCHTVCIRVRTKEVFTFNRRAKGDMKKGKYAHVVVVVVMVAIVDIKRTFSLDLDILCVSIFCADVG